MSSERSGGRDRRAGRVPGMLGVVIRSRWLVTALAILSACAGVAGLVVRLTSPDGFAIFTLDLADLRTAAFVFGVVALNGSMDHSTPGPGVGPPKGWQRGTFLLSVLGGSLGLVLLVVYLVG
ncbi:hypothetical protein [Ruania alba]|uniref:Uncharacterized protein n=1 Tax=Ruania alba TaxID=648782 RepID=A0A1H5GAU4_9MICO|nr:hypothetical protein [Ruania alba]SEE12614.1 hypothetical protein SAMN04488554_1589 [Ruania alba]